MCLAVSYYNDGEEQLETENKTIGIVTGKLKNHIVVEYVWF